MTARKGTRRRTETAAEALRTFAFQILADFVSRRSLGGENFVPHRASRLLVPRYLVLYDHDFELLWSVCFCARDGQEQAACLVNRVLGPVRRGKKSRALG